MSTTDIIGWASLAAFGLGFVALYLFITRPSRRLEKLMGDGTRLALRKLDRKSADWALLRNRLAPLLGGTGNKLILGSLYQRVGGSGFLLSVSERTKSRQKTTYRHTEKYVYLGSTGLATPFGIMPKPPDNGLSRFALGMMQRVGMEFREDAPGLLPEFRDRFLIHGPGAAQGGVRVPPGVQRALLRASHGSYGFDPAEALAGAEGISLLPDGFVIHLSTTGELKTVDQIRGLLEMTEGIETGLRLG
jgi:hypothetical protein